MRQYDFIFHRHARLSKYLRFPMFDRPNCILQTDPVKNNLDKFSLIAGSCLRVESDGALEMLTLDIFVCIIIGCTCIYIYICTNKSPYGCVTFALTAQVRPHLGVVHLVRLTFVFCKIY